MTYTKEQLVKALQDEWEFLCHDDYDPDKDGTMEEHLEWLKGLTYEQLIEETSTGETFTIDESLPLNNLNHSSQVVFVHF